uniref:Uncharacterized protein n=1 Tax=Panagrolaimus sp. JU765 TaxID=591449 RepID=A0AC34RDE1_9BILA
MTRDSDKGVIQKAKEGIQNTAEKVKDKIVDAKDAVMGRETYHEKFEQKCEGGECKTKHRVHGTAAADGPIAGQPLDTRRCAAPDRVHRGGHIVQETEKRFQSSY